METAIVNLEFNLAFSYLNETSRNIYLTGKAGTGKTTFLRRFKKETTKKILIAAPTGVAAKNAGGVTLSSLFQLPQALFFPTDGTPPDGGMSMVQLISKYALPKEKSLLLNELELLIIDEVSMLRADILDAIDHILRHIRRNSRPFGGVQMVLIGDLFQLPPVIKNAEWAILSGFYKSRFFFDAKVVPESRLLVIELGHVFRQEDPEFLRLLNHIRLNQVDAQDMALLDARVNPDFNAVEADIYLTSLNATANELNQRQLERLPGQLHILEAQVTGEIAEKDVPVMISISLKTGARVMLVTNDKSPDKKYFNGKIGIVGEIKADELTILFSGEEPLQLQRELFQQMDYRAGKNIRQVEEAVLGELRQFPIRLAWAVTIHKSQGLTFDKAVIDAGRSFEAGQIYVALSRVRSLNGVTLASRLSADVISCNPRVVNFSQTVTPFTLLAEQLPEAQTAYLRERLLCIFDFAQLTNSVRLIGNGIEKWKNTAYGINNEVLESLLTKLAEQSDHTARFRQQLSKLLQSNITADQDKMKERVKAAAAFYSKLFSDALGKSIKEQLAGMGEKTPEDLTGSLKTVDVLIEAKMIDFSGAIALAEGLTNGTLATELCKLFAKPFEPALPLTIKAGKTRATKKEQPGMNKSLQTTYQLYQEGNNLQEIATARNVSVATVQGHLAELVLSGLIDVLKLVAAPKMEAISACVALKGKDVNVVKIAMGADYSFFEVRVAINHLQFQEGQP
jgi:hypothetical protein